MLTFQTLRVLPRQLGLKLARERTVVRIGNFSIDVVLEGKEVRLGKLRFCEKPRWATPALLRLDVRVGQQLATVDAVKQLLLARSS